MNAVQHCQSCNQIQIVNPNINNSTSNIQANSSGSVKSNEVIKSDFSKIFKERFKDKASGAFASEDSLKNKRICANIIMGLAVTVAAVSIVASFVFLFQVVAAVGFAATCVAAGNSLIAMSCTYFSLPFLSISLLMENQIEEGNFHNKKFSNLNSNEAIADFVDNGLSYKEFTKKYENLFTHGLLNRQDVNTLLKRDCLRMNSYEFLSKHQVPTNFTPEIKKILDSRNLKV